LRHWRSRFLANREEIKRLAGYDDRFCRVWELYLAGCEIAFRYMNQMVFQIQLARRQDAVPLTRLSGRGGKSPLLRRHRATDRDGVFSTLSFQPPAVDWCRRFWDGGYPLLLVRRLCHGAKNHRTSRAPCAEQIRLRDSPHNFVNGHALVPASILSFLH